MVIFGRRPHFEGPSSGQMGLFFKNEPFLTLFKKGTKMVIFGGRFHFEGPSSGENGVLVKNGYFKMVIFGTF